MKIDLKKNVSAWKEEPLVERLEMCRVMLKMYGLLTEAESRRVFERLLNVVKDAQK